MKTADPVELHEEVVDALQETVREQLHLLRTPKDNCWQPSDFMPDLSKEGWDAEIRNLQEQAGEMSDAAIAVLVGNMITEEALPSYQTWLNRHVEFRDQTGTDPSPWAVWTRAWTAEENRHGDLLNRYLYLTGRVDMRAVEVTIQNLISNGFNLNSEVDVFRSIVYPSFQERATKVSHRNMGRLAAKQGDKLLSKICATIAGDESRHEEAYKNLYVKAFELDPSRAMIAFYEMMGKKIVMPAKLMDDQSGRDVFNDFALVAQKADVYSTRDYGDIIQHLIEYWNVSNITGLTPEAEKARDKIMKLPERYHTKADNVTEALKSLPAQPFSWIFNRTA